MATGNAEVDISQSSWDRIIKSRKVVEDILQSGEIVYGINTGFGALVNQTISDKDLQDLESDPKGFGGIDLEEQITKIKEEKREKTKSHLSSKIKIGTGTMFKKRKKKNPASFHYRGFLSRGSVTAGKKRQTRNRNNSCAKSSKKRTVKVSKRKSKTQHPKASE